MARQRTQVAIIGAGPSGLLLGQLLHQHGIDSVIVERRSGDYVLSRIRAGVLEEGTIDALCEAGVGDHPQNEGLRMGAVHLRWDDQHLPVAFDLAGKYAIIYGQTRITRDLMDARAGAGLTTVYEAEDVSPHDFDTDHPWLTYHKDGEEVRVDCDFIAGCDGFHGVSRQCLPKDLLHGHEYEKGFPFGWLGILADVHPVSEEAVWINETEGFLMCSLRSHTRSRYYLQVPAGADIKDWSADRFWSEFSRRLPRDLAAKLETGPALEMSITPLHSYVCTTMQCGKLFLVGDAVHVVPPTGAKGLNLAVADAKQLADAFHDHYTGKGSTALEAYTQTALLRIWKAVRFSWWMTNLSHKISDNPFDRQIQLAEYEFTRSSIPAQTAIAANFCGLA